MVLKSQNWKLTDNVEQLKENKEHKHLHRGYALSINGADVDKHKTHQWLKNKGLKEKTQVFTIAEKDGCLFNRNFLVNIKMCRYNIQLI